MAITSKTYELRTPKSDTDANYEEFEYYLVWQGRQGNILNYLFTSWETNRAVDTSIVNSKDAEGMYNKISDISDTVTLSAENLTLNDLKIYSSVIESKVVTRVYKDGAQERVGLVGNSLKWVETEGRYDMTFDILLYKQKTQE